MEEYLTSVGIRGAADKAAALATAGYTTKDELVDAVATYAGLYTATKDLQTELESSLSITSLDAAKLAIAYCESIRPGPMGLAAGPVPPPRQGPQGGATTKMSKRVDPKISTFKETETVEEMERKSEEFKMYMERSGASGKEASSDLYLCCETPLRQKLRTSSKIPSVQTASVETLMKEIHRLTTPRINIAIERQEFRSMKQEESEKALDYESRLRQKAKNCKFRVCVCSAVCRDCDTSPFDNEVAHMLVTGMYDTELQREMYEREETDVSTIMKAMVAKETAVEQQAKANRVKSSFQKKKEGHKEKKQPESFPCSIKNGKCARCGGSRPSDPCRAFGKACEGCGKQNHFKAVCRGGGKPARGRQVETDDDDDQTSGVGRVMSVPIKSGWIRQNTSKVSSLIWNARKHTFVEKLAGDSKEKLLSIKVETLHNIQIQTRGFRLAKNPVAKSGLSAESKSIPDTGAEINLAGRSLMRAMGVGPENLHKNNQKCMAVGNHPLEMLGFLPVTISTEDTDGKLRSTEGVIYFAEYVKTTLISLTTLKDLGSVPSYWPKPPGESMVNCAEGSEGEVLPPPHSGPSHTKGKKSVRIVPYSLNRIDADDDQTPEEAAGFSKREATPDIPEKIPFPPTRENIPKLKKWLVDQFASSSFNTSSAPLAKMSGPPMTIHVDPAARPRAIHKPIPVPHHWHNKVRQDIQRDVELGIIEEVPMGVPTRWQARMVVVAKKNGDPRRTVDLSMLNDHCLRETHPTEAPFYQVSQVKEDSFKSCLDCWNGYHAVELDEDSRNLTMFITPWGRYRYRRAPQGFLSAGDAYTRRADEICKGVTNMCKVIDDSLIYHDTIEGNFFKTFHLLKLCGDHGITFNVEKFQFCERDVEFAGFQVTESGIKPSKEILRNISEYPAPTTLTDARSWFGLIEQVAWAYSISDTMTNFRDLTKPTVKTWQWTDALQAEFEAAKLEILRRVEDGVRTFDVRKQTCLATDWSKLGLGFLVLQKNCECSMEMAPRCCREGWVLVFAGSRRCTDAETRYAPICGEALGVAWSLTKARMFTLGCKDLLVTTDHNPLVAILGSKSLEDIANPRLLRLKEKTLRYSFKIKYMPGKMNQGPDAFSRAHAKVGSIRLFDDDEEPSDFDTTMEIASVMNACVIDGMDHALVSALDNAVIDMTEVALEGSKDQEFLALRAAILEGFPEERLCRKLILPFFKDRTRLSIVTEEDLETITFTDSDGNVRVFVPRSLRNRVKESLHAAHQRDLTRVKMRANQHVYWPSMAADIKSYLDQCRFCQINRPSQHKEPMLISDPPTYPFEKVAADYFLIGGIYYLVYVDRFSGWPEVAQFSKYKATAATLITSLREMFIHHGVPAELSCDNGTTLVSNNTRRFLKSWGVQLRISSPGFAQSNGRAECAVKMAKKVVTTNMDRHGCLDTDEYAKAMLAYRNSVIYPELGRSIAQTLLGRHLKDALPAHKSFYQMDRKFILEREERENSLAKRNLEMVANYNKGSRELHTLQVGSNVRIQNQTTFRSKKWDRTGVIVEILPFRRYLIRVDGGGRTLIRNRRFIVGIPTPAGTQQPQNPTIGNPRQRAPDRPIRLEDSDDKDDEHDSAPGDLQPVINISTEPDAMEATPPQPVVDDPPVLPMAGVPPRRSSRPRTEHIPFQAQMLGKSHG